MLSLILERYPLIFFLFSAAAAYFLAKWTADIAFPPAEPPAEDAPYGGSGAAGQQAAARGGGENGREAGRTRSAGHAFETDSEGDLGFRGPAGSGGESSDEDEEDGDDTDDDEEDEDDTDDDELSEDSDGDWIYDPYEVSDGEDSDSDAIPSFSPWAGLQWRHLIRVTTRSFDAFDAWLEPLLSLEDPDAASGTKSTRLALRELKEACETIEAMINPLEDDDRTEELLSLYFPGGAVPDFWARNEEQVLDPGHLTKPLLALFARCFPCLRRIVVTFSSRREMPPAWRRTTEPNGSLPHRIGRLRAVDTVADAMVNSFACAHMALFRLSVVHAVAGRMASDTVFLDALALAAGDEIAGLLRDTFHERSSPPDEARIRACVKGLFSLRLLTFVASVSPGAWTRHCAATYGDGNGRGAPLRYALEKAAELLLALTPHVERLDDTALFESYEMVAELDLPVLLRVAVSGRDGAQLDGVLRQRHREDSSKPPDICDHCRRVPGPGAHLLRCGRCKVARYCAAGCQRAAWEAGHRGRCVVARPA
ncbi:hypothetical protein DFJ74DRAFT_774522 [Hyaloraphidium curvatum]|nr:hypothetical protein DFJ74DRAFT_774522 [Hyaloraphidium curvatum]